MNRTRFLTTCLAATALAGQARADALDLIGGDTTTMASANAVALGRGVVSVVTGNPAMLPLMSEGRAGTLILTGSEVGITLRPRPAGTDVTDDIYSARLASGEPLPHYLATDDLPRPRGGSNLDGELGLLLSSSQRLLDDRLHLGWLLYLPLSGATQNSHYADEREAPFSNSVHAPLLEDQHGSATLAGAGSYAWRPWLTLGAGLKLGVGARTTNQVYVPDALDPATADIDMRTEIAPSIVPVAGLTIVPWPGTLIGASARTAHGMSTSGGSNIQLWSDKSASGATAEQPINFVYDWQPARIALAGGWVDDRSDLVAEVAYRRWSQFEDDHGERPEPGFHDTFEVGLSGRLRTTDWDVMGGLRYVPTPVPPQTGRTNYADADRITVGAGAVRSACLLGAKVYASFGLQVQALQRTSVEKDAAAASPVVDELPDEAIDLFGEPIPSAAGLQTNNPGYPGYTVEGWLWSVGFSLSTRR